MNGLLNTQSMFNLQATLSASSSGQTIYRPHHPITCGAELRYEEDGTFACPHLEVGPEDPRTQQVLHHSVAILLLEMAHEKFGT